MHRRRAPGYHLRAMICAECGHEDPAAGDSCSECGKSPLLDGRYRLLTVLGQGAFGTTWRGERVEDGREVCLKELLYQRLASFEPEEQFRREAAVLRQLDVPGVPAYFDDFSVATGRAVSLFLVQELVEGETLAQEMDSKRYREDEVLDVLEALLQILDDLHSLSPPVVHRDIKPTNVMRRLDGRLALIDFGAVKDVLQGTQRGGPSVAGTIGFMAPEQLHGRSGPATDLYGAGALAIALLSRRDPADLLDDHGRLDWTPHVSVKPAAQGYLAKLLHRSIDQRPASARAALEELRRLRKEPAPAKALVQPKPAAPKLQRAPARVPVPVQVHDATRSRTRLFFAGLAAAAIVGGGVYVAGRSDSAHAPVPAYSVPDGILGLRLGMSLDEAKATSPEVAQGREGVITSPTPFGTQNDEDTLPRLSGALWSFYTTIGGQPSRCQLEFAVDEHLSRIACTFDRFESVQGFNAAKRNLLDQLRERYDLPAAGVCGKPPEDEIVIGTKSEVDCRWTGNGASLVLNGRFEDMKMFESTPMFDSALGRTSTLRLSLATAAHDRLVGAAQQRKAEEERREADAIRSEREAKEAAERRRIEEAASRGL